MKKLLAVFSFAVQLFGTTLSGSFKLPNGSGATGVLQLSLAQQAALINGNGPSGNACGGPIQILPNVVISISFSNGTMQGGPWNIYGNDCVLPQGTFYNVRFNDSNGNMIFTDMWIISGDTEDIGNIVSVVITGTTQILGQQGVILTNPLGNQTIVQQPSTSLSVNTFNVTDTFFGPGGTIGCNTSGCDFSVPTAFLSGFTAQAPSSVTIGAGNFYARVFSGADASCTGVSDGWMGIRVDTKQIEVCLGGAVYKTQLN